MSADASKPADAGKGRGDALLWISLVVFGLAAAIAGKIARPGPLAEAYVEVVPHVSVLVREATKAPAVAARSEASAPPTAPAPRELWVESDDPRISAGALVKVEGVAPIVWEERSRIDRASAHARLDAARELEERLGGVGGAGGTGAASSRPPSEDDVAALKAIEKARVVASPRDAFGIWIAAVLTLGIFSFLVRDNPFYKVVESILIGVSAAYWMVDATWSSLVPKLLGGLFPDFTRAYVMPDLPASGSPWTDFVLALVPLVLGVMLLWRLAPRGGWIAVWPLALIIGTFAGMRLTATVESDLMAQVGSSMKPLVVMHPEGAAGWAPFGIDVGGTFLSLVGIVGVASVLIYFFFSLEHRGLVGRTARVGIWYLMITFGAAFGLTVMGRITLLAQRFEFLFQDWLNLG